VAPPLGLIRPTDGAAKLYSILDKRFTGLDLLHFKKALSQDF